MRRRIGSGGPFELAGSPFDVDGGGGFGVDGDGGLDGGFYGGAVVDEADGSDPGRHEQTHARRVRDDVHLVEAVGVHRHGVVELNEGLGLDRGRHGAGDLTTRARTGGDGRLPGGEGTAQRGGGGPLDGREADVAAREGEPVGLAHGGTTHDLDGEAEVGGEAAHHRQLLV